MDYSSGKDDEIFKIDLDGVEQYIQLYNQFFLLSSEVLENFFYVEEEGYVLYIVDNIGLDFLEEIQIVEESFEEIRTGMIEIQ